MKWRRILGWVAVFLAMSGSTLGSEPEKRLQVRWSELKKLIGGKKVTLQLAEGARVEGRIRKVTDTSLVFKVKKSSKPADYPKGKIQIPKETGDRGPRPQGKYGEAGWGDRRNIRRNAVCKPCCFDVHRKRQRSNGG